MPGLSLSIALEWEERTGDCKPCKVCKEPIYLKRYVLVLITDKTRTDIDASFCESCYNIVDDGDTV